MTLYLLISALTFVLAWLLGKPIIKFLKQIKSVQSFRELGPQSHIETKSGTPTMGGWIFLIPIIAASLALYYYFHNKEILLLLTALISGALMGSVDDGIKILKSNYKGLSSWQKLFIQFLVSSAIVYFSDRYLFADIGSDLPASLSPFLIAGEFLWAFIVIAGTSNAINLSDGLDGLATLLSILAFAALGIVLELQFNFSLVAFSSSVIAALLAFLIFNFKPAKIFMGDTGSLALGMALGALAYLTGLEWFLLVFAIVPVVETVSVIVQVLSAKFSRKFLGRDIRPFKMAPIHHHFELCGMPEVVVVIGFALVQFFISGFFIYFLWLNPQLITPMPIH